jgi:hypothetical protein
VLTYDETPALAARARIAARAVLGLVLDEQRAARFVYEYSSNYFRQGIAGEAEHKQELLSAIERESLLLIAARIERALPHAMASLFSRLSESEAVAAFRQAFLTYLGGTLAWDSDEREAFRRDLALYLRLAARENRAMMRRPGAPQVGGAFVDRCAFLVDPSMLAQAREAAARFQAQLESCADEAMRAAFRGLRAKSAAPAAPRMPRPAPAPNPPIHPQPRRAAVPTPKPRPKPSRKMKRAVKTAPEKRRKRPSAAKAAPVLRRLQRGSSRALTRVRAGTRTQKPKPEPKPTRKRVQKNRTSRKAQPVSRGRKSPTRRSPSIRPPARKPTK